MEKINILIVEDETMVREMLVTDLQRESYVGKVYEAWNERNFVQAVKNHSIDMILLDMKLEGVNGLALFKKLARLGKRPDVVAFTALTGEEVVINCLKSGIDGMMHKDEGYHELLKTINSVRVLGTYFSPAIKKIMKKNHARWDNIPPVLLDAHDMDILRAVSKGLTNAQIGGEFKISKEAAGKTRSKLMHQFGVENAADLMIFACRNGLLTDV